MPFDAQKYNNEFNKKAYYEVKVRLPKSKKEVMEALTETTGKSINRIFIEAVEKQYGVDLTYGNSTENLEKYLQRKVSFLREFGVKEARIESLFAYFHSAIADNDSPEEFFKELDQACDKLISG